MDVKKSYYEELENSEFEKGVPSPQLYLLVAFAIASKAENIPHLIIILATQFLLF